MQFPIFVSLLLLKWSFARPSSPENTSKNASSSSLPAHGSPVPLNSSMLGRKSSINTYHANALKSDGKIVNGSRIAGLIEAGKTVIVFGKPTSYNGFTINFYQGEPKVGGEIVFHCSVRFEQKEIVLNSLTGGQWQEETKGPLPFGSSEQFTIAIYFKDSFIDVYARGGVYNYFINTHKQVLPVSSITHFGLRGDVKVFSVKVTGKVLPTPFNYEFDPELFIHHAVKMDTFTYRELDTFEINLVDGQSNIALHVRYRSDIDGIIGNSKPAKGQWGEEIVQPNPFVGGGIYEIMIAHNPRSFDVIVNGRVVLNVPDRFMQPINSLKVANNIIVSDISVIPY